MRDGWGSKSKNKGWAQDIATKGLPINMEVPDLEKALKDISMNLRVWRSIIRCRTTQEVQQVHTRAKWCWLSQTHSLSSPIKMAKIIEYLALSNKLRISKWDHLYNSKTNTKEFWNYPKHVVKILPTTISNPSTTMISCCKRWTSPPIWMSIFKINWQRNNRLGRC